MFVCMYLCMYVQYVCMYVCMYVIGISWSTRSVERRAADGVLPARQGDDEVDQHEILSQNIRKSLHYIPPHKKNLHLTFELTLSFRPKENDKRLQYLSQ